MATGNHFVIDILAAIGRRSATVHRLPRPSRAPRLVPNPVPLAATDPSSHRPSTRGLSGAGEGGTATEAA